MRTRSRVDGNQAVSIVLRGPVPAKKNRWHRGKNGSVYFDKEGIGAQIAALTWQAKAQYHGEPLEKPAISATFYCLTLRPDLDNMWTTVQDCLVTAGVLKSDNLKYLPGPITIRGQVTDDGDERVELTIAEAIGVIKGE